MPFNDTSVPGSVGSITNRYWDLGDGTTTNTSVTSFVHTYTSLGPRTVTLMVYDGTGGVSTNIKPDYTDVRAVQPS